MKNLILLTFIMICSSCASTNYQSQIGSNSFDIVSAESMARYNQARLINSRSFDSDLVTCYKGSFSKGLKNLKRRMKKEQNSAKYWRIIGTCYLYKDQLSTAKFYYELALSQRNITRIEKAKVYSNIATYYTLLDKDQLALPLFNKAQDLYPGSIAIKLNIAQLYISNKNYYRANEILDHLLQINSKDIDILYYKAFILLKLDMNEQALTYFRAIPKAHRSREEIATAHSLTLYKLNQPKKAILVLKQSSINRSKFKLIKNKIYKLSHRK